MLISESIVSGNCFPHTIDLHRAKVTPPSRHDCVKGLKRFDRFFYVVRGEINIHNKNGTDVKAPAGTVVYLPSDVEYTSFWSSFEVGEYITLQFVLKDDENSHLALSDSSIVIAKDKNGELHSLFSIAYDEYIRHEAFAGVRLNQLFFEIFHKIIRRYNRSLYKEQSGSSGVYKAIIYINDNYMIDFTVEELAKMCGLSLSTFRRLFKAQTGTSPIKYKNNLKLLRAREMLGSGLYNVSEIVEIFGFCDMPYFNKIYKQKFGTNPSDEIKVN